MDSGGAYYNTAVALRKDAATARGNYGKALSNQDNWASQYANGLHPAMLILQNVGLEIAAALCCVAQAIEDAARQDNRRER